MNRWRLGLRRFDNSPYANLLISYHAYWLYAGMALTDPDPAFAHPLFWKGSPEKLLPGKREGELDFITELEQLQQQWMEVLRADAAIASWIEPMRAILSKGATSTNPDVRSAAVDTVHKLGARGFREFRDLVPS